MEEEASAKSQRFFFSGEAAAKDSLACIDHKFGSVDRESI